MTESITTDDIELETRKRNARFEMANKYILEQHELDAQEESEQSVSVELAGKRKVDFPPVSTISLENAKTAWDTKKNQIAKVEVQTEITAVPYAAEASKDAILTEEAKSTETIQPEKQDPRAELLAKWDRCIALAAKLTNEEKKEIWDSEAVKQMIFLSQYFSGTYAREGYNETSKILEDKGVQDLKKSYQPNWKEIVPLVISVAGHFVGAVLGCVPAIGGLTGSTATALGAASSGVSNVVGGGAQSVGGLTHTMQQGEQTNQGNKVETLKRLLQDLEHDYRDRMNRTKQVEDDEKRAIQMRFDLLMKMMNPN